MHEGKRVRGEMLEKEGQGRLSHHENRKHIHSPSPIYTERYDLNTDTKL